MKEFNCWPASINNTAIKTSFAWNALGRASRMEGFYLAKGHAVEGRAILIAYILQSCHIKLISLFV